MILVDVYEYDGSYEVLFDLLSEREPHVNISHQKMPTWDEHCAFVQSRPYREWYIIDDDGLPVGASYLSKQNEIGVFVFKEERGKGYGSFAIQSLIYRHADEQLFANVAPDNKGSQELFTGVGFELCQYTYRKKAVE